jgi:ribosomal protein S2
VYRQLQRYSVIAHKARQRWVYNNLHQWLLSRESWPRSIFVSSVYNSAPPVREALYLGVPCFGVVDTNTLCDFITRPFPGNDESMDCLIFYMIVYQIIFYLKNLLLLLHDFMVFEL